MTPPSTCKSLKESRPDLECVKSHRRTVGPELLKVKEKLMSNTWMHIW